MSTETLTATRFTGKWNNVPTYQRKSETKGFHIYFGDIEIGRVELEESKRHGYTVWTCRDMKGKKVSARKGGWWNSADLLVEKAKNAFIAENGYEAYSSLYRRLMSSRVIEV